MEITKLLCSSENPQLYGIWSNFGHNYHWFFYLLSLVSNDLLGKTSVSKLITVQVLDYQEVQEAENEFDKPYLLSQMNNNK